MSSSSNNHSTPAPAAAATAAPAAPAAPLFDEEAFLAECQTLSNDEILTRIRALDNEIRIMKSDISRIKHEGRVQLEHVKDNKEKIKVNKQLPYLVANVIEIVEPYQDQQQAINPATGLPEQIQDGAVQDLSLAAEGKGVVIKTSTRQTVFLSIPGLVRAEELAPSELVGVNKDSYIILEKLPTEFDSRVKAMEIDEKPQEDYTDIGGLDKQVPLLSSYLSL
jgi:26S proteasome regulatory subunit T5